MRIVSIKSTLAITAILLLFAAVNSNAQTYSGQATAVRATVTALGQPIVTTAVADTGDLPNAGGNINLASVGVNIPGVLGVGSSTSTTSGAGANSQSTASINNVDIDVVTSLVNVTADVVSSSTSAGCPGEVLAGNSAITNLQLNSVGITVLGTPNQSVTVFVAGNPVGTLIINEQIVGPRSITVNALHLTITDPNNGDLIDVVVASSRSGINCAVAPVQNLYSGRGTAVRLRQAAILSSDLTTIVSDTGPLPTSGGLINTATAGVNLTTADLDLVTLSTGVAISHTSGGLPGGDISTSQSNSRVNNLAVVLLPGLPDAVTLNATVLRSATSCTCSLGTPTCSVTDSTITNLVVNVLGLNVPVIITGLPNQVVNIPVLGLGSITLVLNGRTSAGPGDVTAFPLRVTANLTGLIATDLTIAMSHSDIVCGLNPSAAPAMVAGRVFDRFGRGMPRAVVTINDGEGFTRSVTTNTFGNYAFKSVPTGKTYFLSTTAKGVRYDTQTLSLDSDLTNFDIFPVGAPSQRDFKLK